MNSFCFSFLCLIFGLSLTNSHPWGYKYYYNPDTQETQLWTHVPGQEAPLVSNNFLRNDPGLWQYRDHTTGQYIWKCKFDAAYSNYLKKCVWTPAYFARKRL